MGEQGGGLVVRGGDRVGARLSVKGACAVVAAVWMLGGCASRSDFRAPDLVRPEGWAQGTMAPAAVGASGVAAAAGASAPAASASMTVRDTATPEAWWQPLQDPQLDQLIRLALQRNNNLAQSALKAQRARLVAGQAASDQLPSVSAKAGSSVARTIGRDGTTRAHSATLAASWELDLWGRVSALRDAAEFEAQATEADRAAVALSLSASVANAYWQLAYLNQRVQASEQSVAYARQTLKLVQAQYGAGSVSGLEQAQATQSLATQEAAHTQWLQQRVQARNTLALLMDGPPGAGSPAQAVAEPQRLSDSALPTVAAGLPAQLLTRRPDLRAAELRLRKTLANGDATRTAYYPTLSLTGSLVGSSNSLSQVLDNPVATLGAGLVLPFIQWRDMQRASDIAQLDYESAVVAYRQSWYQALADVENALSARQQYDDQGSLLQTALDAARQAERLAEVRYRAGSTPLKTWLDAQETRRQAELSLAANRLNRLNAWVTVVQTLGG
jgi:NodT family efflux transporter outer membrane factor (OMF) lipoprotein